MGKEIEVRSKEDLKFFAKALAQSGYYDDVGSVSQAVARIQAGMELGLGPATSLSNVRIVQGKPSLSSHIHAGFVKQSDKYNYKVKTSTDEECVLEWFEDGEKVGESSFSVEDAERADLLYKDNWKKYPGDMCFARAVTQGVRRFAPDVVIAGAYTPEELQSTKDMDVSGKEPQTKKIDEEEQSKEVQEAEFEIEGEPVEDVREEKNKEVEEDEDLPEELDVDKQENEEESEERENELSEDVDTSAWTEEFVEAIDKYDWESDYREAQSVVETIPDVQGNQSHKVLQLRIKEKLDEMDKLGETVYSKPDKLVKKFHALGKEVYGDEWDDRRAKISKSVSGGRTDSSKLLEEEEMSDAINKMEEVKEEQTGPSEDESEDEEPEPEF